MLDKLFYLKFEKCIGGKYNKVGLIGMVVENVEGEKFLMFVIGKFVKFRCFIGVINLFCRYCV